MKFVDTEAIISESLVSWRELAAFAIYRLFLAIALFIVFFYELPPEFLGKTSPNLYQSVSQLYLVIAIIFLVSTFQKKGIFEFQTTIQLVVDIVVLTLILYSSGGLSTGLGILLVVVVVTGGALVPGRLALFIAAIATVSILAEVTVSRVFDGALIEYSLAGMLGTTFFITALLAQALGKKTQQLQRQHVGDVTKLSRLNQHIIERLHVGVMIVDKDNIVYSTNKSAQVLLGVTDAINGEHLSEQLPELFGQLGNWRHGRTGVVGEFQPKVGFAEVLPEMIGLEDGDTLVFLTDTTELTQQAQQMKLASLGHMAASIAHEVRNPLGAINHAAELLSEAEVAEKDQKLLTIIQRQSQRVNGIIDAVLQLGRRKILNKSTFILAPWLEQFIEEFKHNESIPAATVYLKLASVLTQVRVDQEQLRQIMVNLCTNAWHYSDASSVTEEMPQVWVRMQTMNNEIMIDVLDNGSGVSETALSQLFEPFHSERTGGIGLGLFLAREMALANGIRLEYLTTEDKYGGYFRVTFNSKLEGKM
ncbi:MAG: sensor histidine kinase [Methylophaga sp.]|nr:sensor histidine kinase [Methylophaga sp.]